VFVSHVQSEPLEATLAGIAGPVQSSNKAGYEIFPRYRNKSGQLIYPSPQDIHGALTKFFLDYITLRQCIQDFHPVTIAEVIQTIKCTRAILDTPFTYPSRSFCIFELAATLQGSSIKNNLARVRVEMAPDGLDSEMVDWMCDADCRPWNQSRLELFCPPSVARKVKKLKIDSKNAETLRAEDKQLVDDYIDQKCSFRHYNNEYNGEMVSAGFTVVDTAVSDVLSSME